MNENQRVKKDLAYLAALDKGEGHHLDKVNYLAYERRMCRQDADQYREFSGENGNNNPKNGAY
jgi:hypothetical protein